MRLKGKVALVTGSGSGIGREIALAFAGEGAKVGINDIAADRITFVQKEIEGLGGEALGLQASVADSREVKGMFAKLLGRFGRIDILVNNAGIAARVSAEVADNVRRTTEERLSGVVPGISLGVTRTTTDEAWQRMISVHLSGTFYCTREALNSMEDSGYGRIINIASICGLSGCASAPEYSAAKGGIIAFTKAVAKEVVGRGILVNAIAPGFIDTGLGGDRAASKTGKVEGWPISARIPLGRLGTVDEIASLAVFLASDESGYMVGQIISPNGGAVI